MFSSRVIILFFCIFSQIWIAFGDVHTAFDVGGLRPERGGCQLHEREIVEETFTEVIEMVGLIRNAITALQAGTESPAVGSMFKTLFGIMSTEELNDVKAERPQEQTAALEKMDNLFALVERHSIAQLQLPNSNNAVQRSRINCNELWLRSTSRLLDQTDGSVVFPFYPLPRGVFPGVTHWYDIHTNIYLPPATELAEPDKMVCGNLNGGHTSTDTNVITFCPQHFSLKHRTVASTVPPVIDAEPPMLLDAFAPMSMTFLHEYTHLVGRSSLADAVPDVDLFPEYYQYDAARSLSINPVEDPVTGIAIPDCVLKNADSYALLGVALKLSQCDWRDGACRSPGYWEAVREQQRAAAQLINSVP